MLKALELIGFKSFADKTRFEFPRGVTVVVGPNGSGKSNVVDAIKWALGEQSVKSLRGKEMVDVIFNGAVGRKPVNSAEVTLTFDNSDHRLPIDAPEVHVTRRVYRSGEGEYLLNRQACRLRDIRDVFAGTGVATEAYSIIEQGKVDVMLQSSPRERRLIFEEAAGISRFKAKKIEAQRRLERVDQNLLRLGDIVEEVESRLRTVRLQASKAQKYKEYSDRLYALRSHIGRLDWQRVTEQLHELETELANAEAEVNETQTQANEFDALAEKLDLDANQAEHKLRESEKRNAQYRERIAALQSAIEQQHLRRTELEAEIDRLRKLSASILLRTGGAHAQRSQLAQTISLASDEHRNWALRLGDEERRLTSITTRLDQLRDEVEQRRQAHLSALREVATCGKKVSSLDAKAVATADSRKRRESRVQEAEQVHGQLAQELAGLEPVSQSLAKQHTEAAALVELHQKTHAELAVTKARLHDEWLQSKADQLVAVQRAEFLAELSRRMEGVTDGVKEILAHAQQPGSPFAKVLGIVADRLQVGVEAAPLIEAALGEQAQHLVLADSRDLIAYLRSQGSHLLGRVGLVRLDASPPGVTDEVDLAGQPGIVGRADQFVETEPDDAALAKRLLGHTWIVETLSHALALQESLGRRFKYVTLAGEVLAEDGTLIVGSRRTVSGLIARRSELKHLEQHVVELERQVAEREQEHSVCSEEWSSVGEQLGAAELGWREIQREFVQHQQVLRGQQDRLQELDRQRQVLAEEHRVAAQEHVKALSERDAAQEHLAAATQQLTELEMTLDSSAADIEDLHRQSQEQAKLAGAAQVELAKVEQHLGLLREQQSQHSRDEEEQAATLREADIQLSAAVLRRSRLERETLHCESELAHIFLHKEEFGEETAAILRVREEQREQRQQALQEAHRVRNRLRKQEAKLHAKQLAAEQARHEKGTLLVRFRDDYQIDLEAPIEPALFITSDETDMTSEPAIGMDRSALDTEIADLRSKLNSIGGVNLEALAELESLEERFTHLSQQHQDLTSAKNSLDQIISRINADSRKLFADTLDVVRGHFQNLFRKLFGGGQADIVLDEGVDILESGIEIVARPPGKEPRSISLLSGGEKTLTCVALLMSIFRSRPSPFCVLDEVDAALDEANIERFVGVIKEFLETTQFVVVTHSKRTMTCADTLYGVTMQESGISKRVAVRFEDVSETGEILHIRPEDEADTEAA